MRKLNKRYEKSLKSIKAQRACACSLKCYGCATPSQNTSASRREIENSNNYQNVLWST